MKKMHEHPFFRSGLANVLCIKLVVLCSSSEKGRAFEAASRFQTARARLIVNSEHTPQAEDISGEDP